MAGVFHNYDVRGIFEKDIDELFAQKLGVSTIEFLDAKSVVIGHDERIGSNILAAAIHSAIDVVYDGKVKVIDIGLCTTPMVWHAVGMHKTDCGIMVTASHNPKEYVGFKICTKNAIPIGYDNGLDKIEKLVQKSNFAKVITNNKILFDEDISTDSEKKHYKKFSEQLLPFVPDQSPLKIIADCSNGAVAPILVSLLAGTRHELILINDNPDGNFPAHEPNPLIESTTQELSELVVQERADVGVIFDGDADRVVFVDEKGNRIRCDFISALLGKSLIERENLKKALIKNKRKETSHNTNSHTSKPIVLADLRSSKIVEEIITQSGGQLFLTKVGRPHIIKQLHETKGLVAGELSGHYYFHDFFCCDDGVRAFLEIMQILASSQKKFSEIVLELEKYANSSETNVRVTDVKVVLSAIKQEYQTKKPIKIMELDGISVYFEEFWFNVRGSNTEPLLRINMEADNKKILDEQFATLIAFIKKFMN